MLATLLDALDNADEVFIFSHEEFKDNQFKLRFKKAIFIPYILLEKSKKSLVRST